MELVPFGDRLIVKRIDPAEKVGTLYIPESAQTKQVVVDVRAVGNGRRLDDGTRVPVCVSVGDKILMDKYAGMEVDYYGEECQLILEEDVWLLLGEGE